MHLSRRELIIAATALPLACKKSGDTATTIVPPGEEAFAHLGFFVPTEARVMDAVFEQLLPANIPPGTPGAREALFWRSLIQLQSGIVSENGPALA